MTVVKSRTKYGKIAPSKVHDLARAIQNMPVAQALGLLLASKRRGAALMVKTLRSAIANAENNHDLSADRLVVLRAAADEGPRIRRYWPRSRGMVSPVLRRSCHIVVEVGEKIA